MALTTIPEKDFDELVRNIHEKNSGSNFSWEEVEKDRANTSYRDILNYMKTTNVKKIGTGSSRTAFFLPEGSVKGNPSVPSCFKVAKNKKGVAQNKAEINLFRSYGEKRACFPELYEADDVNEYYIQTEVGKKLNKNKNQLKDYFADWNRFVIDMKMGNAKYPPYYFFGTPSDLESFENDWDYTYHIFKMVKALNEPGLIAGWGEDPEYVLDDIADISDEFPKYKSIVEMFRFSVEGGWKQGIFDDLSMNTDNWAFVVRNGEYCLLPIDYGFTNEVQKQFYF